MTDKDVSRVKRLAVSGQTEGRTIAVTFGIFAQFEEAYATYRELIGRGVPSAEIIMVGGPKTRCGVKRLLTDVEGLGYVVAVGTGLGEYTTLSEEALKDALRRALRDHDIPIQDVDLALDFVWLTGSVFIGARTEGDIAETVLEIMNRHGASIPYESAASSQARLRVFSNGNIPVSDVVRFLRSVQTAYCAVDRFLSLMADVETAHAQGRLFDFEHLDLSSEIKHDLILERVAINSPGFWEFIGKLNPLEVLRLYLNDRHERKKDEEYRSDAEKRRLMLENQLLENKFIKERIKLARELGATKEDLRPVIQDLLGRPLSELNEVQRLGLISESSVELELVAAGATPDRDNVRGPSEHAD